MTVSANPAVAAQAIRRRRESTLTREQRRTRLALGALLLATAVAYLWNLSASGDANSFYAAAVQAGTKSWKALFFGSLDSSNYITVDKPPASLWVMALSGRIFGFSSWSMLAPQALEGVAAVALLYAATKRWFGAVAGLGAAALFAATPVAALMFRFNDPDALLVLGLVAGAYCLVRALEDGSTRWLLGMGAVLGLAFLAKMGQAFLVMPGFWLAYFVAAPVSGRRRVCQLLAALGVFLVAAGWWVGIVALLPASSRPFIDGSPDNNIFNLIFQYNGFGRLFGSGAGAGGNFGGGSMFGGATGLLRLFNPVMGGQAGWLLPASLAGLVSGLWLRRRAPRVDRTRAALILWGGWLLVTGAVFSFSKGTIHSYYLVALAPAISVLVAIGAKLVWERRDDIRARAFAALVVGGSAIWSYVLLDRTPSWEAWLRPVVLLSGILGALGLLLAPQLRRAVRGGDALALSAALIGVLAGPLAYTVDTIGSAHTGPTSSAGPAVAGGGFGGFGAGGGPPRGAFNPAAGRGARAALFGGGSPPPGANGNFGGPGGGAGFSGAPGSNATGVSAGLVAALKSDAGAYRWVAATDGSSSAATYELASGGEPVMAIGGFVGSGGNITVAQFKAYVAKREIHYYLGGGGGGGFGPGGGSGASAISSWVAAHYNAQTIGGVTVYDLTRPRS